MSDTRPTLYVCHGDTGGPKLHPCRRVQAALHDAGIGYDKVIAGHGSPIPFLRKDDRQALEAATGTKRLPTLRAADGTVVSGSARILRWVREQTRA